MNDFIYATTPEVINKAFANWVNEELDLTNKSLYRLIVHRLYNWFMSTQHSNNNSVIRFRLDAWSVEFQEWIQSYIKINEQKPENELLSIDDYLDLGTDDYSNFERLEATHIKQLSNDLIELMSSDWAIQNKMIVDPIFAATHKTIDHAFKQWIEETGDDERRLIHRFFDWFMATDIAQGYVKETGLICFSFNAWLSEFQIWIEHQILANSLNESSDTENPLTVKECLDINDPSSISKLSEANIKDLAKQLVFLMSSDWPIKHKLGLDYLT